MEINWEVEDGYAGGARPQSVEIDEEEIKECESKEELVELIEDAIQEQFKQDIGWSYEESIIDKIWQKK